MLRAPWRKPAVRSEMSGLMGDALAAPGLLARGQGLALPARARLLIAMALLDFGEEPAWTAWPLEVFRRTLEALAGLDDRGHAPPPSSRARSISRTRPLYTTGVVEGARRPLHTSPLALRPTHVHTSPLGARPTHVHTSPLASRPTHVALHTSLLALRSSEQGGDDERHHGHQLDEDVHGRARGVLEGIAHGIADYGGAVGIRALAPEVAGLDVLLGVVPGAPGIGHHQGEEHSHQGGSGEESTQGLPPQDEPHDRRQDHGQDPGHDHLLDGRSRGDRDAASGIRSRRSLHQSLDLAELAADLLHHAECGAATAFMVRAAIRQGRMPPRNSPMTTRDVVRSMASIPAVCV